MLYCFLDTVMETDTVSIFLMDQNKDTVSRFSNFPDEKSTLTNKKVIAVGKQSYQKGFDRLLNAWALLGEEFQDWQLHIYGKLDENLGLEKLAEIIQFFSFKKF